MSKNRKKLLIVDDTEIDRIILKSILVSDFDIVEAGNGNQAFEYITTMGDELSGILLDISMPHISGFDVLRFMEDKNLTQIPVFLVTAEPTKDNVTEAMKHKISEFISKPFDREDVIRRLRSKLGIIPLYDLGKEDLRSTKAYIADMETLYKKYLTNFGRDDSSYQVRRDLMRILLVSYSRSLRDVKLTPEIIDLVSAAAYFCDVGKMFYLDKRIQLSAGFPQVQDLQYSHPALGASFIRLNRAKSCGYFVEVCSGMCLHHHERYDGKGYPDGLVGDNNSLYNQLCRLVDEFEEIRARFSTGGKNRPVRQVVRRLADDNPGMVDAKLFYLMEDCEPQIVDYFMKKENSRLV